MWEQGGRWHGRLASPAPSDATAVVSSSRAACLARLRQSAGPEATLTVEEVPALVGVAEAAAILEWDKRRIFTYISRGSFPEPVALLASGRVWRREDIEVYAATRRSRPGTGRKRGRE